MGGDRAQVVSVPLAQGVNSGKHPDPLALIEMTIADKRDCGAFIPSYLDDYGLDPFEFRLYGHLARRAGSQGHCWEGIKAIALHCCMDQKTASAKLMALESYGLLQVERRTGQTNLISLTPSAAWKEPHPKTTPPKNGSTPHPKTDRGVIQKRIDTPPKNGSGGDPKTDHKGTPIKVLPLRESQEGSSSADRDRSLGGPKPTPFFESSRTVRRIEHVQTIPRWDANAPWADDEQRKAFDDWLRRKYSTKHDPARYAATIVGATAKGQPSVDWEEFSAHPQAMEQQDRETEVLKQWGDRQDWENFPLLADWSARCKSMGWVEFGNLGGRYSPQCNFAEWWRESA
jgi:DNA-binding MarR family transcriptional regulator